MIRVRFDAEGKVAARAYFRLSSAEPSLLDRLRKLLGLRN